MIICKNKKKGFILAIYNNIQIIMARASFWALYQDIY